MKVNVFSSAGLRHLSAVAALGGVLTVAPAAFALDKMDIMNLQAAGLSPDVIVQVIRSSVEPLTVTAQEVEELRIAGLPQPVLDEICMRVGCGTPTGPVGPVGPGGPSLEEEIRRQQELEAERIRLEQERMESEREAMRARIEAENAARATATEAFAGLEDAERAVRGGNYVTAARLYDDFLSAYAQPGSNEYYEALTGFVRSMHARGYRHVVRSRALEAVLYGPTSAHFEEMFGILTDISAEASYLDPRFEDMTAYSVGQYSTEFQDEFNFFLGRFFWVYGESTRALEYLGRVSDGSADKAKSHYLAAVILLAQNENTRAYGELQRAIVAGEANPESGDVAELAYLALARIAYEVGQFDAALYYYQKVDESSFRASPTLFEEAWAYFMKQDWNRAVGALHSLHSPYYSRWFWPDLYVMEAATYLETCDLDGAEQALAAFNDTVTPIREQTSAFIAATGTPDAYWSTVQNYYETIGTPDEAAVPIEAIRWVLRDADFLNLVELIEQLEDEAQALGIDGVALGTWADTATSGLAVDLRTREIEAGLQVSQMVRDFAAELDDWNIKAQEVGIEVSSERISMIGRVLEGGSVAGVGGTSAFVLAQDWQLWPFEGEYWFDEVTQYRGDLVSLRDAQGCTEPPPVVE